MSRVFLWWWWSWIDKMEARQQGWTWLRRSTKLEQKFRNSKDWILLRSTDDALIIYAKNGQIFWPHFFSLHIASIILGAFGCPSSTTTHIWPPTTSNNGLPPAIQHGYDFSRKKNSAHGHLMTSVVIDFFSILQSIWRGQKGVTNGSNFPLKMT